MAKTKIKKEETKIQKEEIKKENKELNIEKTKIEEEIKKAVLKSLDEEIPKRIEIETKNKFEKQEKRIKKIKNASIIRRDIIIVILFALIVFETKILYDNNLLAKNKSVKENKIEEPNKISDDKTNIKNNDELNINDNDEKEEIVKDNDWYIRNYSYLLDKVKTNLDDDFYLYREDYTLSDIDNKVKLNMAYQLLDEEIKINNSVVKVSENDLKKTYEEIFGNLDEYRAENFDNDCVSFIYNEDSSNFLAIDTTCEEKNLTKVEEIKNIYETDDSIIIETIIGIYDKDSNVLKNIDGEYITDETYDISIYESSLNLIKYTFKKDNDNYYLSEIKRNY